VLELICRAGVVISGTPAEYDTPGAPIREVFVNARAHAPITELASSESFSKVLDPSRTGVSRPQVGRVGYHNPIGGWANAALGVQRLYEKIAAVGGGELVRNAAVKSLIYDKRGNDVVGVTTVNGANYFGDKVILAMGSWTGPFMKQQGLFPDDPEKLVATGLGLGAFQLSKEDVERYKDVPVIMAWDGSGFYCFPVCPYTSYISPMCLFDNGAELIHSLTRPA
jgi:sarcosine oxidase/L-pipecolate oxidase